MGRNKVPPPIVHFFKARLKNTLPWTHWLGVGCELARTEDKAFRYTDETIADYSIMKIREIPEIEWEFEKVTRLEKKPYFRRNMIKRKIYGR